MTEVHNEDVAKRLNAAIDRADPRWGRALSWRVSPSRSKPRRALAELVAVLGDEDPVWVSADVDPGTEQRAESFTVVAWTAQLVVHVEQTADADWPVASVFPRSALAGLRILQAPVPVFDSFDYSTLEVELTYPTFSVVVSDDRER